MSKKIITINETDEFRYLLTEMLPAELPVIISNYGFYNNIKKYHQTIKDAFLNSGTPHQPYNFQVDNRVLSIFHPTSQIKFRRLYKDYSQMILDATNKSKFSLRRPTAIKDKSKIDETYSEDILLFDNFFKYSIKRIYNFYKRKTFFNLQKKYNLMLKLDVSKHFYNIYTHSISWALYTKKYSQKNKNENELFGNFFDKLMQDSNNGETSGILVGSEVSRIFAEIIMQRIDLDIQSDSRLTSMDYKIKRYVDDYFIFSNDDNDLEIIQNVIEEKLLSYKLHINHSKIEKYTHPIITPNSIMRFKLDLELNDKIKKIFDLKCEDSNTQKFNYNLKMLAEEIIPNIQAIIKLEKFDYKTGYKWACQILIRELLKKFDNNISNVADKFLPQKFYLIMKAIFFLFVIVPDIELSLGLGELIININKFENEYKIKNVKFLFNEINRLIQKQNKISSNLPIFLLNIIIPMRQYKEICNFNPKIFENYIDKLEFNSCYFQIVSILYYIENDSNYIDVKNNLIKKLSYYDFTDCNVNCHSMLMFLDISSCPFIIRSDKNQIFESLQKGPFKTIFNLNKKGDTNWFVNWGNDILFMYKYKKRLAKLY